MRLEVNQQNVKRRENTTISVATLNTKHKQSWERGLPNLPPPAMHSEVCKCSGG